MKFSDFGKKKPEPDPPPSKEPPSADPPRAKGPPPTPPPESQQPPSEPAEKEPEYLERDLPTRRLFSQMPGAQPARPAEPPGKTPPPAREVPTPAPARARSTPRPASSVRASADAPARARAAYARAIGFAKELARDPRSERLRDELPHVVRDLAGCLGSDDNTLLTLACKSTAGNFLYGHCVNVTILSLHACLGMNPSGEGLTALGAAAFLHDLDDDAVANASDEAREAATHALSGGELKSHFREIQRVERDVRAAILPGEPDDHRETMSRFAQILCVCDIYEANTHPRDWRTPLIPHDALKKLIRGSLPGIEDRIVKFFLERMSLFPPGSFVQLSSGEIAAVVGVHAELPTRPILEIRVRSDGQKEAPGVRLDLGEHPVLHVAKAIDETAVPMRDAKLQLQFQANRWWTD